ncbi:hypothetical protein Syn7502_00017 [Synechococcus sp. PCC 7502]|uniref:hypothetical protein n=1 Tax=Synechococcus sp. PCC 7502 TaxID=1173263 RepID=UPI00029FF4D4|nr:hypothetical protein [Synechococcus sp. PCC 7502]AFY72192.1 hypothetical protein Syn7502_00017 [Synechococcus sp. PCC 7502]
MKNNGSKKISPTLESLNIFFKTLGLIVFCGAIIPFVVIWWLSRSLEQAIILALVFDIMAIVLFLGSVKSKIVQSAVIPAMVTTSIDNYPRLDRSYLDNYTQRLESLGFKHLGDIGLAGEQTKLNTGVARIFWHPEHNCLCEIGQNFSGTDSNKDVPMRCVFGSLFDKAWTLATSNMANVNGIVYMMRRPKSLWQRYPEYGLAEIESLLRKHLDLREEISSTLNLAVQANLTLEDYIHHEEDQGVQRHYALEKKNILVGLIEAYLFELKPKFEWLGDYAKFAKRNKKQG